MPYYCAQEETLDRASIEQLQRRKFAALMGIVRASNPFYQEKFSGLSFDPLSDPLSQLPFTTRAEIQADIDTHPPYGTNRSCPLNEYIRLHQTSGTQSGQPLRWMDTEASWVWCKTCWRIVFRAAGLRDDDVVAFPFSFGPFIGFWMAFDAAQMLGNRVLAAGGMTTKARLQYILDNHVTVICCTPTYAMRMVDVASQEAIDLSSSNVRMIIVGGEPGGSIPTVRQRIESGWGARLLDHAGMTEAGAWGFECIESPGGVHVIESEFIVEVIDPDTQRTVVEGQPGELVLTTLGRAACPVIRYRTGDLVVLTSNRCDCGRWFARLEGGIQGRIDDMLFIRGNNVFPSAIEAIIHQFTEVEEFRLVADHSGGTCDLRIEIEPRASVDVNGLEDRVAKSVRDRLLFRPDVAIVKADSLPRFDMKARRLVNINRSG